MGDRLLFIAVCILLASSALNTYIGYINWKTLKEGLEEVSDTVTSLHEYTAYLNQSSNTGCKYINNPETPEKNIETSPQKYYITERKIPIVAVSGDGYGVVGNLSVKIIPGNNNVLVNTNPFTDTDIQYSINKAAVVAKLRSNYSFNRDFIYDFSAGVDVQLVGGESAGAALTLVTLAALQDKKIRDGVVITGTINPDGSIGKVGGVLEKAKAAADAGYKYFLIPAGQSNYSYYEKVYITDVFGIKRSRYILKTIDLKKEAVEEWNLTIVEVNNIEEATPYFFE